MPGSHYVKALAANASCSLSPSQRANIIWYSPSSRKIVALFVNIGKRDKRKPFNELPQRGHCKVTTVFLSATLLYLYLVRTQKIYFLFGKLLTYLGNRCKNNCTGNIDLDHYTDLAGTVGKTSGNISG